jgi:hypothetical protein
MAFSGRLVGEASTSDGEDSPLGYAWSGTAELAGCTLVAEIEPQAPGEALRFDATMHPAP